MTIHTSRLPNGIRIVTDTITSVETVALGAWFNVGSRQEPASINGAAHFLEHMIFKGTAKRSAKDIAQEIENVGGYLNAYTGRDTTAYHARILKDDAHLAVDILSDIIQNSTFEQVEFEREQGVILQEIAQSIDTPDDIIFDYFQDKCYAGQAIGRPILGTSDIIKNMTPDHIRGYMNDHYGADQLVLSAAGHIDHDDFVDMINESFTNLKSDISFTTDQATYQGGDFRKVQDLEQAHLILGFESIPYTHNDYYTMSLFTTLFGGGMSSRLFQEIREKRGLAYSVYCSGMSYSDSGQLLIYTGTAPESLGELIPALCGEITKTVQGFSAEEISRAKAQLKASLMMSLESIGARCERNARQILMFGRIINPAEIIERIDAINDAHIIAFCQSVFNSNLVVTALGPVKNLAKYEDIQNHLRF